MLQVQEYLAQLDDYVRVHSHNQRESNFVRSKVIMIKYLLIIQVCSSLTGQCEAPQPMAIQFNDHYHCAISGYSIAGSMMKEIGDQRVNDELINIRFGCKRTIEKEEDV